MWSNSIIMEIYVQSEQGVVRNYVTDFVDASQRCGHVDPYDGTSLKILHKFIPFERIIGYCSNFYSLIFLFSLSSNNTLIPGFRSFSTTNMFMGTLLQYGIKKFQETCWSVFVQRIDLFYKSTTFLTLSHNHCNFINIYHHIKQNTKTKYIIWYNNLSSIHDHDCLHLHG